MKRRIWSAAILSLLILLSAIRVACAQSENDQDYAQMKSQCLTEYGYFGNTPLKITHYAANAGLYSLGELVEENIEPWWSYWWSWTPPENNESFQEISEYFRMFRVCDIDGSLEMFPGLEDIDSSSKLSPSMQNEFNNELKTIGQRVN